VAIDEALEASIAVHLAAGDLAAAATAALRGLGPQILGYLTATLRDDDVAYDVFGQFSEELWKSIATFRGESSFKTWAYKLVMHAIGRHRRDPYRNRGRAMETDEVSALALDIRSKTPRYKQTEVKDKFAQLRESLDPTDQTLLFLRIDQGLSWNDVAAIMSAEGEPVEPAALRKRLERAKDRLKKLAAEHGLLDG
jgi:RNA polymerase sigma-70 factor (ECF subfamily)